MRKLITTLHRWAGLGMAVFLFISGITGAVISWDHELDGVLNPHLIRSSTVGDPLDPLRVAQGLEDSNPQVRVTAIPLQRQAGETLVLGVTGRVDPVTGRQFDIGYNQVFFDAVTGVEVGRREWGAPWPITRENFVSFLYKLHYSLQIPEMWGIDRWGIWLLGTVGLVWTFDCFFGVYLTLPIRREAKAERAPAVARQLARGFFFRWKPAWKIKTRGSAYRINFDIHRAFGLWTWLLLLVLAFTAFSLNLNREVFLPILSLVSKVTPAPTAVRSRMDRHHPIEPKIKFADIVKIGEAEVKRRGWNLPIGDVFYLETFGVYVVRPFEGGDDEGSGGVGPALLWYDGLDGRYLGDRLPWKGTVADIFVQAQFPVHSGRILGITGRILISVMGLVTAALSVTGVVIWYRKRLARSLIRIKRTASGRDRTMASAE